MPEKAREIFESLRQRVPAEFDEGGSIGKRYRRQDEIGTPWGVTVDHQTMEDDTVTLRDRDSLEQIRVPIEGLGDELASRLAQPWRARSWAECRAGSLAPVQEDDAELTEVAIPADRIRHHAAGHVVQTLVRPADTAPSGPA
jgi:hypothetical protein